MYPEGSADRKQNMDEFRGLMNEISLLEAQMHSYLLQTAKRPRLSAPRMSAAVDSLFNATMNKAPPCPAGTAASSRLPISIQRSMDNNTGLAADNAGLAATIEFGPCRFQGCELESGHVCQGSCGFYVCITCCDEKLDLQPGAYYCNDCFEGLPLDERLRLCDNLHRV
jgi:hypothetical protein